MHGTDAGKRGGLQTDIRQVDTAGGFNMAAETITAANVLPTAGVTLKRITAAVAITQGQVIAKDADKNAILADANGSAYAKVPVGIAVNAAAIGQPVDYVDDDATFAPGFTPVAGEFYILSATAGGICVVADSASGWASVLLGIGSATAGKLNLKITAGGSKA